MKHTYHISGMTCNGCLTHVTKALEKVQGVNQVNIDLSTGNTQIDMQTHVPTHQLKEAVQAAGSYVLSEPVSSIEIAETVADNPDSQSDYRRLYPLFLVFGYLIAMVGLTQIMTGEWDTMEVMQYFMGGFFVVFSFFKFLDLKGFAYSFASYDPIASRWMGYGYAYPFIELALGIAYLLGTNHFLTNLITILILSIGTIGVARTLLNKQSIQCACLGTVFNLPMTKVTLTENSLMIVMAGLMLGVF